MMMQKNASQVIWDWQKNRGSGPLVAKPSLVTAAIGLAVGVAIAALFFFYGHRVMATVVAAISLSLFACALFFPRAYHAIQIGLQKFSFWVGQTLTWLLLTPFFYLIFSFGRFVQKTFRRDPMTRSWRPEQESYWVERPAVTDKEQYKRQF